MIRYIRLTLYFLCGVMISLVIMAPANASVLDLVFPKSPIGTPMMPNGPSLGWGAPVLTNAGGGAVNVIATGEKVFFDSIGAKIPVPMTLAKKIGPGQIASNLLTIGKLAKGTVPTLLAGFILEAGYDYIDNKWWKQAAAPTADQCLSSCYTWQARTPSGTYFSGPTASNVLAQVQTKARTQGRPTYENRYTTGDQFQWRDSPSASWNDSNFTSRIPRAADVVKNTPVEVNETEVKTGLEQKVVAYPDPKLLVYEWPTEINPDPNYNYDPKYNPWAAPQVLTGPATVTGPAVVTKTDTVPATQTTPAQTTTTTKQSTAETTYKTDPATNISSATTNITTTTTTINNAGDIINQTKESTPEQETVPVVDSPLGDIPKLYTKKYPDGMQGAWNTRSAEMKATPLFGLSALFAPSIAGGTCPSWNLNMNIGPKMNFGNGSISPPCWIWTAIKAMMIITALLISRRLVFGG